MAIVMVLGSVEDEKANPSLGGTIIPTTPKNGLKTKSGQTIFLGPL
jgi:hypothetical protein